MSVETITMTTPTCHWCGNKGQVEVPKTGVHAYLGGAFAQVAFPDTPAEVREQFISGTHPACWTAMFGEGE